MGATEHCAHTKLANEAESEFIPHPFGHPAAHTAHRPAGHPAAHIAHHHAGHSASRHAAGHPPHGGLREGVVVVTVHVGIVSITASMHHLAPCVMLGHPAGQVTFGRGPAAHVQVPPRPVQTHPDEVKGDLVEVTGWRRSAAVSWSL